MSVERGAAWLDEALASEQTAHASSYGGHDGIDSEHPWLNLTTTMDQGQLERKPEPREMLCKYFPAKATSALVSMGGVGKTTWTTRIALQHVSDDMHVLFVSSEDDPGDYHAKLHNAIYGLNPVRDPAEVEGKIHVLNFKGHGVKLIGEHDGSFVPSADARQLPVFIKKHYPKVRVVFFETVSRFAGGEDNDRMEAIVSACDGIALAIDGACVLVHHTGKGQARSNIVDLYAGRGGSALGDNTRSFIVLTRLSSGKDGYMGEQPTVIDHGDIEAGRAFEVKHVRSSYSQVQPPEYYVSRMGHCHGPVLEPVPVATDADITRAKVERIERQYDAAANKVHEVIKARGGRVPRGYFDTNTRELIGLSQKEGRDLIKQMLDAGSLGNH